MVYLYGAGLPRLSWKKAVKQMYLTVIRWMRPFNVVYLLRTVQQTLRVSRCLCNVSQSVKAHHGELNTVTRNYWHLTRRLVWVKTTLSTTVDVHLQLWRFSSGRMTDAVKRWRTKWPFISRRLLLSNKRPPGCHEVMLVNTDNNQHEHTWQTHHVQLCVTSNITGMFKCSYKSPQHLRLSDIPPSYLLLLVHLWRQVADDPTLSQCQNTERNNSIHSRVLLRVERNVIKVSHCLTHQACCATIN